MKFKTVKKILIFLFLLICFCSCTYFSPTYKKPKILLPSKWSKSNKNMQNMIINYPWWESIKDKQLNSIIEKALKNSKDIHIATNNILLVNERVKKSKYSWLPIIGFGGGAGTTHLEKIDFSNRSGNSLLNQLNNFDNLQYDSSNIGFSMNYNLNLLSIYNENKLAKLDSVQSKEVLKALKLNLITQITAAYFSLVGTTALIKLENNLCRDSKYIYMKLKKSQQLGYNSAIDVENAKQKFLECKFNLENLKQDQKKYQNGLKLLMGENPGNIKSSNKLLIYNLPNIRSNIMSTVLHNRPDISIAEIKLKKANVNIGLARSQFFPTISLTGTLGKKSMAFKNLMSINSQRWNIDGVANLPILNLKNISDINQAKIQYKSAYENYIKTIQKAFNEVENSLNGYEMQKNRLKISQEKNKSIAKNLKKNQIAYNLGNISYLNLKQKKIVFIQDKMLLIMEKIKALNTLALSYEALAAGYNYDFKGKKSKKK